MKTVTTGHALIVTARFEGDARVSSLGTAVLGAHGRGVR